VQVVRVDGLPAQRRRLILGLLLLHLAGNRRRGLPDVLHGPGPRLPRLVRAVRFDRPLIGNPCAIVSVSAERKF
jgi:hypothetical protein